MLCVIRHECRNANGPDRWRGLVEGRHQGRRYHPSCACPRSGRTRGLAQCAGRAGHPVGGQGAAGAGAGTGCRAARCPRVGAASGSGEPGGHVPSAGVSGPLREPGAVTLRLVGKADAGRWRAMVERHHPRGCPQAPGAVLGYWIVSGRCGCIGGIGFRAAGRHVRARDEWIGWPDAAKAASPGLPVNNHRFLPLPGVAVPNLASHVPDRVGRCLPDDREARHGQRPQVACTCVDEPGAGSCYRAANRHFAGMTAARARSGEAKPQCGIFMRPLERGRRQRMAEVPRRPVGTLADSRVDGGDGTGDSEFAYSTHCDGRVRCRPPRVGDARLGNAGGTIRGMFPNSADQTAGCRPLSNPDVTMRHVLESHVESTVGRCRAHRRVPAVRDTTMPTCSGLAGSTEGLASPDGWWQGIGGHCRARDARPPARRPAAGGAFGRRRLPGEGRERRDRKPALAGGCRDLRGTGGGLSRHRDGPRRRPRTGHPGHPPRGGTDGPAHRAPCLPVKKTPGAVGNRPAPKPVFPHGGTARTRTRHRRTRRGGRRA